MALYRLRCFTYWPSNQCFRDLYRIQCRAFAKIVGHDPETQAVFDRWVLADAADIYRVFADAFSGVT